jgi:hypothetical protein
LIELSPETEKRARLKKGHKGEGYVGEETAEEGRGAQG